MLWPRREFVKIGLHVCACATKQRVAVKVNGTAWANIASSGHNCSPSKLDPLFSDHPCGPFVSWDCHLALYHATAAALADAAAAGSAASLPVRPAVMRTTATTAPSLRAAAD